MSSILAFRQFQIRKKRMINKKETEDFRTISCLGESGNRSDAKLSALDGCGASDPTICPVAELTVTSWVWNTLPKDAERNNRKETGE